MCFKRLAKPESLIGKLKMICIYMGVAHLFYVSNVFHRHEDGSHVSVEKLDKKVKVSIPHLSLEISTDGKKTDVKV